MELMGKITKKNDDLSYGFVNVPKLGDIFFSKDTSFSNTSFEDIIIGQKVKITAVETPRGLFAADFQIVQEQQKKNQIEDALI
jgi:cold shock CspA family protein